MSEAAAAGLRDPRILLECVRTLYRQIPNSFIAALVVTVYMTVTTWKLIPHDDILLWLGLQGVSQIHRFWIYQRYRRSELTPDNALEWARRYAWYMAVAGLVWGSCAFLFFKPESPLGQALTMCGLYGISGGAVPGNAYFPPAIYAFVGLIFGSVMIKMLMMGDAGHIALGVASLFFALIMILFCRVQYRTLVEGFRIRFENAELLESLRRQTQEANDARARAEQANLAKSQFLAAASHDLRQPLHALSLFSASLQQLRLDDEGRDIVERILSSIGALEGLFNALLDVSRLDAGVIKPDIAPLAVQGVLARVRQYAQAEAEARGIGLDFVPTLAVVRADAALLERIVGNLVANAIRYTASGRVAVACRRAGADAWRIEVRDSGVGIAPADHARIFEEFVQLGNPERDRRKGLGLGLAIAQRTAALMDSRIVLKSRPGRGSVFSLTLPLATALPIATAPAVRAAMDLMRGLRVLVLDDEEAIREGFVRLLRGWGAEVDAAGDLAEALALQKSGKHYDALLADYRLRDNRNGIDAIDAFRAGQLPPPVACLITGDTDPAILQRASRQQLMLLQKPVHAAQLRAALNHLLVSA